MSDKPISVTVSSGVAISAKSTSTTPGDHVVVFNLAADGGANNAGLNVVSANTAFTACEVTGHETGHGTVKISHVNPGPDPHPTPMPLPPVSTSKQARLPVLQPKASS
jgi:hypothetical protein